MKIVKLKFHLCAGIRYASLNCSVRIVNRKDLKQRFKLQPKFECHDVTTLQQYVTFPFPFRSMAAPAAKAAAKVAAKSADSTLYHVAPQGFWKKFRTLFRQNYVPSCSSHVAITGDAVVVNPEISSGLPMASVNRNPQPGSRPELYSTPASKGLSLA